MNKRVLGWTLITILIAAVLGGAYLIVANNNPALNADAGSTPAGVFH